MDPCDRIIVALDAASEAENAAAVARLRGHARWFKVGMRAFYRDAESSVSAVRGAGGRLFLDLKLHDIPATVAGAVSSLAPLSPELLTLHASGGPRMIEAARETVDRLGLPTRLLAVTVLTSLSDMELEALGWTGGASAWAARWGRMAVDSGAHGLVCSAWEASGLRVLLGPDVLLVTPGIRPAGGDAQDQSRVQTPRAAVAAGADLLVVGRPLLQAADPVAAWRSLVADLVAEGGT
jgi:orotidine-5'-phosphate decarboxylase